MKKTALLFLAMMLGFGWSFAQRETYLKEDFSAEDIYLHADLWDTAASEFGAMYFSGSKNAGGRAPEALWAYYPKADLTVQMDMTCRLISKPITTKAGMLNYVSVKYDYSADKNSATDKRVLGLAARKDGGEWQVCAQLNSMSHNLGQGVLIGALPASMQNTSGVEISLFFKTTKDNINYMLYFDDIEFYGLPENAYELDYAWIGKPYTTSGNLNVGLELTNVGNVLDNCEISYTLDDGAVQTLPLTFSGRLYPGKTFTRTAFNPEGWNASAHGKHKVEFWLSKANGEALPEDRIVKQTKYLTNLEASVETLPYRPLVEHFSSATCGPCAAYNAVLNDMYEELADTITLIKYQVYWPGNGDPYYRSEAGDRCQYYGANSVPTIVIDGSKYDMPATTTIGSAMRRKLLGNTAKKTSFSLSLDTVAIDTDYKVHVTVRAKSLCGLDKVRLHTAVMENTTVGNASSNGEKEFHHVMLAMTPDGDGLPLNMQIDSTYTISYVYDMRETFMEEFYDLKVVCFLQADDKSILQSAIADVTSYSKDLSAAVSVDYMPTYICGSDIPAGLNIIGMGGENISSVEVTAKVGATGTPLTQTYNLELAWGESAKVLFQGLKAPAAAGQDTVYFQVTKVNGTAMEGRVTRQPITVQPTDIAFAPLMEGFVSAEVMGSVALNQYLDGLEGDVAVVKYPMQGDAYTRSFYTRYAAKMGIAAAPGLVMNGYPVALTSAGAIAEADYFTGLFEQVRKNNGLMSVSTEGITIGESGTTALSGTLNFAGPLDGMYRLYMMVVETETRLNVGSNGETSFKRIVQAMFPDENGNSLLMRGGEGMFVLARAISASKVENYANLSLVVIVKDKDGKEVLQTAEFKIDNQGVANEEADRYSTLAVYPNPTSDYVYIKNLEEADIDVLDVNGAVIFSRRGVRGDYTLDVQSYTAGTYVIKVNEGGRISTARISVVR